MVTDTEAMVLKQVKTLNGRRMLLLFTKKFGKISVGTSATEGGRNKSALAVRPFTYGRYEL
ncbi:MAG: recombination protein O N-terminal domain-containing protein, partial [Firmicutes bacterium]|nr:recombination protein O N-terminal domain-containing protein [Bacillota bacterium]